MSYVPGLSLLAQRHLTYPVLHHFQAARQCDAIEPNVAIRIRLFVLLVLAIVVVGCVGPARSQGSYAMHAAVSLTSMRSAAAAGVMVTQQAAEDRVTGEVLAVVARESEDHARHIGEAFGTRQPPDEASRRLRTQVLPALNRAREALAGLRIAAFDGDVATARRHAATLEDLLPELDRLAGNIRR